MAKKVKNVLLLPLLLLFFSLLSCSDFLTGPDPENTPQQNFDILYQEFDRYYPFFEFKKINWDSLYHVYRPQVSTNTGDRELLSIMTDMLDNLRDGHVNIYTPFGDYAYTGWYDHRIIVFQLKVILTKYLNNNFSTTSDNNIYYGKLSEQTGYIYIKSFDSKILQEKNFTAIDDILDQFYHCDGIIIDVRENGGGNTGFAKIIASRFADEKRLTSFVRYRNGPGHNDFTDYIPQYCEPGGKRQFTKPVVVLTNRRSFSATEYFVFAMRALPHVTIIGDTTGGGMGIPISRELPNGWSYRLPRSMQLSADSVNYEGIGLAPDILIVNPYTDKIFGTDTQLVRALHYLEEMMN